MATFVYDKLIMQYGVIATTVKILIKLVNGLKSMTNDYPYGYMLAQVCGLALPYYRLDETEVILRCITYFRLA
jgi:hypothetical protein